jgi:hypothetical protein
MRRGRPEHRGERVGDEADVGLLLLEIFFRVLTTRRLSALDLVPPRSTLSATSANPQGSPQAARRPSCLKWSVGHGASLTLERLAR